jgi:putative ABC transport system permease protein
MYELIKLDTLDLVFALGIIGGAIALSAWQKLGLESQFILAAGRSLLQIVVVGYILSFIFAFNNPWAVLAIIAVMLTTATSVARNRISKRIPKLFSVVWLSLLASILLSLSYTIVFIVQPQEWYSPQYLIPLTGTILGNAMSAACLGGDRLVRQIQNNRKAIETHLCLGATPQQATQTYRKEAIRTGMIPNLNQMAIVGIVSLPGTFNGQVLSGVDPLEAVSYQILILFLAAFASLLATFLVTATIERQFFNRDCQLIDL